MDGLDVDRARTGPLTSEKVGPAEKASVIGCSASDPHTTH